MRLKDRYSWNSSKLTGKIKDILNRPDLQSIFLEQNRNVHGVALMMSKKINKTVIGYETIMERIMKIILKPCILNLILYGPTTTADDETIEEFFRTLEEKLIEIPKKEITISRSH